MQIVAFLSNFKQACDTHGIRKEAAMWLFQLFMKILAASTLHTQLVLTNKAKKSCLYRTSFYTYALFPRCQLLAANVRCRNIIADIDDSVTRLSRQPE